MINGSHSLKFSGTINVSPSAGVPFPETKTSSSSTKEPEVSETGSQSFPSGLLEQSHPSHSLVPSSNREPYNHQWFKEKVANFFCKVPDSNYFRLCGPYSLCDNYPTLPLQCESNHRRHINKRPWLCSDETFFMDTVI